MRMQQMLYSMKVHCTHRSKGCEWTDELRDLDDHVNDGSIDTEHEVLLMAVSTLSQVAP